MYLRGCLDMSSFNILPEVKNFVMENKLEYSHVNKPISFDTHKKTFCKQSMLRKHESMAL